MKEKKIYQIVLSAVFAALSAVLAGFVHIPNAIGGYVHIADAIVYLGASLLPLPYAALSAGIGFALADLVGGYYYYMLPSALIRAVIVVFFTSKDKKILCRRNYIALIFALLTTVSGYFAFKYILYGFIQKTPGIALSNAVLSIPGNIVQCVLSSVIYIIVSAALDRMRFKDNFNGGK